MIAEQFAELLRLQRAAVIALKPLVLETEIREAREVRPLLIVALRTRRSLKSTRFLSTQIGLPDAARRVFDLTRPAWEALGLLIAECEGELGDGEEFATPLVRECADAITR